MSNTMNLALKPNNKSSIDLGVLKYVVPLLVLICILLIVQVATISANLLEGFTSEKLIQRSGVGDSNLLVGQAGVADSDLVVGLGPSGTTGAATNVALNGGSKATLNGTLDSLGAAPNATVWFQWGYDTSYGNMSSTTVLAAPGAVALEITGYDVDQTVHFRLAADNGDGTNFGADSEFLLTGHPSWSTIIRIIPVIFLLMSVVILFTMAKSGVGTEEIITGIIVVAVAIAGFQMLLQFVKSMF